MKRELEDERGDGRSGGMWMRMRRGDGDEEAMGDKERRVADVYDLGKAASCGSDQCTQETEDHA